MKNLPISAPFAERATYRHKWMFVLVLLVAGALTIFLVNLFQRFLNGDFDPKVTISGRVTWMDGRPAVDVPVAVLHKPTKAFIETRTTDNGTFQLGSIPRGKVIVLADGVSTKVALRHSLLQFGGDRGGRFENVLELHDKEIHDIHLAIAGVSHIIRGQITNEQNQPIHGARVIFHLESDRYYRIRAKTMGLVEPDAVFSLQDGSFEIKNLDIGPYCIWAEHKDWPDVSLCGVSGGDELVRLKFVRPASIEGVVLTSDGSVVDNCSVIAITYRESTSANPMDTLDGLSDRKPALANPISGRFLITGLAPGTYNVIANIPDGRIAIRTKIAVNSGELRSGLKLVAVEGSAVVGKIVQEQAHSPMSGAQVVFLAGGFSRTAVTGADGTFELKGLIPEMNGLLVTTWKQGKQKLKATRMVKVDMKKTDVGLISLAQR